MKQEFLVPDMTCGHCVKMITAAIYEFAPDATIHADPATHWLTVESSSTDPQTVIMKLQAAGYSPQQV